MEMDKNYDGKLHAVNTLNKIHSKLGEGIKPDWDEFLIKWKNMCEHKPPRTFMYVIDIKENKIILSNGMSLLGYEDNKLFSTEEIINMTHENQRSLLQYQTFKLYEKFFELKELFYEKGTVYCSHRALMDAHGKYWLVHQASIPVQFDKENFMTKYLSTYRIIGEYKGDALETEIYTDPKYPEAQKKLRVMMKKIKVNMLEGLGFSKTQREIIKFLVLPNATPAGIAETFDISPKTLANHRQAILNHARSIFPVNNFNKAKDVSEYLKKQSII